jgi:hypothetical protein
VSEWIYAERLGAVALCQDRSRFTPTRVGVKEEGFRVAAPNQLDVRRKLSYRVARSMLAAALTSVLFVGVASAAPNTDATLQYSFTNCDTHADFLAVKQPSGAASVHLVDGGGNFLFIKAVVVGDQGDLLDGTVLFDTRGITSGAANIKTVTCDAVSPSDGLLVRMTGFLTRAH